MQHLSWLLDEVNGAFITKLAQRSLDDGILETPLQQFRRCVDLLLKTAGVSAAEVKALHSQLQGTFRSADESLSDFWTRWMTTWTSLHRSTPHQFDGNDYQLLIRALGPDMQRESYKWEWCDGDDYPQVPGAERISDLSTLQGKIQMAEIARSPIEEHDSFCRRIAMQLARESSHAVFRSPFAVNLENRSSNGASSSTELVLAARRSSVLMASIPHYDRRPSHFRTRPARMAR